MVSSKTTAKVNVPFYFCNSIFQSYILATASLVVGWGLGFEPRPSTVILAVWGVAQLGVRSGRYILISFCRIVISHLFDNRM